MAPKTSTLHRAGVLTALLWLAVGRGQGLDALLLAAPEAGPSPATTTLGLNLTIDANLSAFARAALVREATAIWRRAGVLLVWAPDSAGPRTTDRRLRVLVLESRDADPPPAVAVAVAELLRPQGGHAVAIASIDRARHVVAETTSAGPLRPAQWNENLLGVVLGRALAHEIGHFLLGTATHAERGLMRPAFTANEFVDLRSGNFTLGSVATAWLASLGHDGMVPGSAQATRSPNGLRAVDVDPHRPFPYQR